MKGNFNKIIESKKPVLVDFYAPWCGPCKMQDPIIKDFAKEMSPQVRVIKINVDENQEIAGRFGVRGVPTIALFQNGEMVYKHSGLHSLQQLKTLISDKCSVKS